MINRPIQPFSTDSGNGGERIPRRRADRDALSSNESAHGKRRAVPGRDTAPTKPGKIKPTKLRIIGGTMGGRGVLYLGDRSTRPMKDSLRETLFNILGKSIKGAIAIDLFAGTGVIAIESLSRGAVHSIAIEKSGLAAKTIRSSADNIGIGSELDVLTGDAFRVAPQLIRDLLIKDLRMKDSPDGVNENPPGSGESPRPHRGESPRPHRGESPRPHRGESPRPHWVVFFCPPYAMWADATEKLFGLLQLTAELAPKSTQIVLETDKFFDVATLPLETWDIRPKGNVTLSFLEI